MSKGCIAQSSTSFLLFDYVQEEFGLLSTPMRREAPTTPAKIGAGAPSALKAPMKLPTTTGYGLGAEDDDVDEVRRWIPAMPRVPMHS